MEPQCNKRTHRHHERGATIDSVRTSILAALIALAACGADQITVRFITDRDDIAEIRMAVYAERSPDKPLSCEALEFSEIDPEVLAQSLVTEVSGAPGERVELGDIPREGLKLFFAEAISTSGVSVLAGCASTGAVDGDVVIDIEPRDRLVILPTAAAAVSEASIVVESLVVTDLAGTALRQAEIHWTVQGPAGHLEEGSTTTTVPPPPITIAGSPPSPGPLRVEVRASWAKPVQLGAVKTPPSTDLALPAGAVSIDALIADTIAAGRLAGDAIGVVALVDSDAGRVGQLHCFDQPGSLISQASVEPLTDVVTLGLLRDPAGGKIVGASGIEWIELSCAGAPVTRPTPFSGRPSKLVAMPGCGDRDPALYAQLGISEIEVADPAGEVLTDFSEVLSPDGIGAGIILRTSGCVEDQLGATNPTVVLSQSRGADDPTFRALIAARVDGGTQVGLAGGFVTAVSADAVSTGPGGLQLGQITAEGPSLGRYDLQPLANSTLTASLVGEDPTPSQITELASGDVDGDGLTDMVALLAFANNVQVFISLALPDSGDRLRGFFAGPVTDRFARLRVADLDQDGVDDIILLGNDEGAGKLTVLEMGE